MSSSTAAVLTPNAMALLEKRYLDGGTVNQMWDRVSGGNEVYRNLLNSLRFIPNSPTLFNAGKNNGCTLSACFVFSIDDCMAYHNKSFNWNSIMGTKVKAACVAKAGGGVGYYGGDLRTKGSLIKSVHRKACGSVAVLREYHGTSTLITQGGKRELAQMWITPCWHGDVREVIHCKDEDPQALGSFNISIAWHDDWMKYLDSNSHSGDGIYINKETSLWWEQCAAAWAHGCPGMFFPDVVNKFNINPHLGLMRAPNPCGETPNRNNEPCDLGSLSLPRYFTSYNRGFDWKLFEEDVWNSIYFLDYVLDINEFPHPDITAAAELTRRLGLGVMGWADLLGMMHIHYDTDEAVQLGRKIAKLKQEVEHAASEQLAKEKGPYPGYSAEKTLAPMRRNETTGSIAPTGSISIIAGVWGSIEPHFALGEHGDDSMTRTTAEGMKLQDGVQDWCWELFDGFVPKTADQISPEWHVRMQAAWQEFTDLGVSKCVVGNTLVLTSTGWREIQSLHREREDDTFRPMRIAVHGEEEMVMTGHFYSGGRKETVLIKTEQGSELEGTPNHQVRIEHKSEVVWRRLDQLSEGDLLIIKVGQQVYADNELVSPELACLLGHAIADGCLADSWLVMFHTDPVVNNERKQLLGITEIREKVESGRNTRKTSRRPIIRVDNRTGVTGVQQNSRAMVRWLEDDIGLKRRAANKGVPEAVLQSSWKVQRLFLRGLFTDCGVANRSTPNLDFNTASRKLARQVRAVLFNAGMYTSLKTHIVNSVEYYRLHFTWTDAIKFAELIGFVEPSRTEQFKSWSNHQPKSRNNHGSLLRPRDGYRVERVRSIYTGSSPVFDVSIPDGKHAFITEGIVSHNTVNVPHSATVEDVSDTYKLMYALGCKGGTVYRDDCRSEQVLVKKKTSSVYQTGLSSDIISPSNPGPTMSEAVNREILSTIASTDDMTPLKERKKRRKCLPDELPSIRLKIRINDFKCYLHVGLDENGQPMEIFLRGPKLGSTISGLMDHWAMSFSMLLQHGVPLEQVCNMHKGARFEPAGLTSNKDIKVCSSPIDFVSQWLLKRFVVREKLLNATIPTETVVAAANTKSEALTTPTNRPVYTGDLCPECQGPMISEGNCQKCIDSSCNYTKCG